MKHPGNSLVSRLVISFLGVSLVTVFAAGFISYQRARDALMIAIDDRLEATLELKEEALNRWVDDKLDDLMLIKTQPDFKKSAETVLCQCDPQSFSDAYNTIFGVFQIMFVNMGDFSEVSLLSARGGEVVVSSRLENEGDYRVADTYFIEGMKGSYIQEIYLSPITFQPTITVASPVYDDTGQSLGVLAAHLNMERMDRIILERSGLGQTGESYLVDPTNTFIAGKGFGRAEFPRGAHSPGISKALKGLSGKGLYRNYAGIPVVGAFKWIPERQLAIMAEIEQDEAFAPARELALQIVLAGCLISIFLAVIISLVVKRIASPILAVRNAAEEIIGGNRGIRAPVKGADEIGDLARSFNVMVDAIQESEERLQTLFRMSPGVIVLSRLGDNTITDVNDEFTRITGYSKEEAVGQSVMELGLWEDLGGKGRFSQGSSGRRKRDKL